MSLLQHRRRLKKDAVSLQKPYRSLGKQMYAVATQTKQLQKLVIDAIKQHNNPTSEDVYFKRIGDPITDVRVSDINAKALIIFQNKHGRSSTFQFFERKEISIVRIEDISELVALDVNEMEVVNPSLYCRCTESE